MGKIGEAFVEVGAKTQAFDQGLDQSSSKLTAWVGSAQKLVAAFVAAKAGREFLAFLNSAVESASNLAESLNKAGIAFGDQLPKMNKYVDEMASRFGIVKTEIYDAAAALGFMMTNAGLAKNTATDLSIALVKAATDATSVHNPAGGIGEILQKIRSGMSGEAEPLRPLGVNISEENVMKQAPSLGFDPSKLTDQEKLLTRISLIVKGLAYTEGDLKNTINEYANATRAAAGHWENMKAVIGGEIKPVLSEALVMANSMAGAMKEAFGKESFAWFSGGMKQVIAGMKQAQEAASWLAKYSAIARESLAYGLTAGKESADDIHERLRAQAKAAGVGQPSQATAKADADRATKEAAKALAAAAKLRELTADVMSKFFARTIPDLLNKVNPHRQRPGAFAGFLANQDAHRAFSNFVGRNQLASHVMSIDEASRFSQERNLGAGFNPELEAAKEAAKNTQKTVTKLDEVIKAIMTLRKGFGAKMEGPA